MLMDQDDEHTFLCGYQRIRRYGSTQDLNSPSTSHKKPYQYITHKVEPTDTLQSLELKYNSNMYEIKKINRLWSSNSLHCKTVVSIPIYDESLSSQAAAGERIEFTGKPSRIKNDKFQSLDVVEEKQESMDDFFKRIDSNVKKTQKVVKKLNKRTK